jgi:hypothetical protein
MTPKKTRRDLLRLLSLSLAPSVLVVSCGGGGSAGSSAVGSDASLLDSMGAGDTVAPNGDSGGGGHDGAAAGDSATSDSGAADSARSDGEGGTAACPRGTSYPDGCPGSPAGTPQYPHLLDGYAVRPPWNVAGVDYYVGTPAGTKLTDWQAITDPAISISGPTLRCGGANASVTLNAIDFSLHGGSAIYIPSGGCSSVTITNANFGCNASNPTGPSFTFMNNESGAVVTVKNTTIDITNCGGIGSPVFSTNTFQYNWYRNTGAAGSASNGQVLQGPSAGTLDYRFNYIDDMHLCTTCGIHQNYLQWGAMTAVDVTMQFNTSTQYSPGGAEGPQFYPNNSGTFDTIDFSSNTMISKMSGGSVTMSYMVHGSNAGNVTGAAKNDDNYFDGSGAYGMYYPATVTAAVGWTSSGNMNMVTGAGVTPQ